MPVVFFIHQNMPGQFKNLSRTFAANPANSVYFFTKREHIKLRNITKIQYRLAREPERPGHRYLKFIDEQVLYGQAVARALLDLKNKGVVPDIIFAHSGWGEALYVKEVFPDAKLIVFSEYYYTSKESDATFFNKGETSIDDGCRLVTKNLHLTQSMMYADLILTPTLWQKYQHPPVMWHSIFTLHEGVDVDDIRAGRRSDLTLPNGWSVRKGERIVTYVSRNLEPYRGYDVLVEAARIMQRRDPDVRFVLIGGEEVSYGNRPADRLSWRNHLLLGESEPVENCAYLGRIPYPLFLDLLNISKVHLYLTVPFVLSWSALEAMALESCVLASATHPVREIIAHERNGLLCAHDADSVADALAHTLARDAPWFRRIGALAHATVAQNYDFERMALPKMISEIRTRFGIDLLPPG